MANSVDLHGAIEAHKAWIEKLELTLRNQNPEEYDPAIVGVDNLCILGKWLHGEGKKYAHLNEYANVLLAHQRFHECAGRILDAHKHGYFAEAISLLRRELPGLSNTIQNGLLELNDKINGK